MRYIKLFESIQSDFLIVQILSGTSTGAINKYADEIQLMEIQKKENDYEWTFIAKICEPEDSATFNLTIKGDFIYSDFGFRYKILYSTKDIDDAISNYDMYLNTQKYNL